MRYVALLCVFSVAVSLAQIPFPGPGRAPGSGGGGGGGDITWAELTQGLGTTDPATTAAISPTANAQVFVAVGISVVGGGTTGTGDSLGVSGCGLTWTEIGTITYGTRRRIYLFRGVSASPSSGCTLSLDFTTGTAATYESTMWTVDEAVNVDGTTPNDAAVTAAASGTTSLAAGDIGTPGTGDCSYGAFAVTGAAASVTLEAGYTSLTNLGGGTGVRTIVAGYDCTATVDETPAATWTGSEDAGVIGIVVNKAP